jgi:DNA-binding transcriptional LysR family regulator
MIDRYHLRYYLAVVDAGNFSRAAAACNVSQPTLSVGISKLEQSLGQPLFTRTNRRVALTDAGSRLLDYARSIEAAFAAAEREVSGSTSPRPVRLGILVTTPRRWVETLLRDLRSGAMECPVEIVEGKDRDLRERLIRGRIDLALSTLRTGTEQFATRHIMQEGYSLAMHSAHPLAGETVIRAEDLVNDPMIVRRHCELLSNTSRFFTARGVRPVLSSRTTSDDKALSYVRASLGVTVMPDCFGEPGIRRVALDGFDFTRDIGLIFAPHTDKLMLQSSPVVSAIIAAVSGSNDFASWEGSDRSRSRPS